MDNKALSELIGLIYDAALDVSLWPRCLDRLNSELEVVLSGSPYAIAVTDGDRLASTCEGDPHVDCRSSLQADGGRIASDPHSPVPDQQQRSSKIGLIDLLRSHLLRALEINRQIFETRQERNALQDLLERLPLGMLIVDGRSRVLTYNQKLNQIFGESKGLYLKNNQLCTMSPANTAQLRRLIRDVAQNKDHPGEAIHLHHLEMPLSALVIPFESNGSANEGEKNRVMILVATPEMDAEIDTDILKSLYCLTGAEARLVSSLVEGHSLNAIAETFGVSKHTVRNQLKSVYEKTGTHRQAELVRQVITGPAMLASLTNDNSTTRGKVGARASGAHRHQTMRLPDGRRLGFAEYGIPGGQPVMLMHAANGSRLERHPDETIIDRCGVRLIVPERPGVGLSDQRPRLTLFNWAQDVACLADYLNLNTFNIIGHSLGAVFALACGYKLKTRVGRIVTVAGMGPFGSLRDLEGMYAPYRLALSVGRYAHSLLAPIVSLFKLHFSAETYEKMIFQNLPPVDQALFSDIRIKNRFLENVMENVRRGEHSTLQEALIVAQPWGFDLGEIFIPTEVWHGKLDPLIPIQMARNLSKKLPNCRTHFLPGAGHYFLFHCWQEILHSAVSSENFTKSDLYASA